MMMALLVLLRSRLALCTLPLTGGEGDLERLTSLTRTVLKSALPVRPLAGISAGHVAPPRALPAVLLAGISAGPVAPPLALLVLSVAGLARVRTQPRCLATRLMVGPLGPRTVVAGVLVCRTLWTPTL